MQIAARSYLTAGMALTTAGALAFTPLVTPDMAQYKLTAPRISAPAVALTTSVDPRDITALVNNLNAALDSVSATVTSAVGAPGQTLANALDSAAALNSTLWDGLIRATDSAPLVAVLKALKASANGGLSELADSIGSANDTVTLTTGQMATLLTSTLTGSLGTALHAVADVVNNPLAISSYTGLVNAPVGIVGLALTKGLTAVDDLGGSALDLGGTLVTGVTAQITNILHTANAMANAAKKVSDNDLINGLITAVQGIVSAPITAAVAGVDGLTNTVTTAAATALTRITHGAATVVTDWLGAGTTPGAIQEAITAIGTAPLSPASYTHAISVLVGAGATTVRTVVNTVGSMASIPVRVAANLTTTAANVFTALTDGLATTASGLLQAAGLPSYVYGLPRVVAATVNGAVHTAAFATSVGLNIVATALDIGSAISGAVTSTATTPHAAISTQRQTVTLSMSTTSGDGDQRQLDAAATHINNSSSMDVDTTLASTQTVREDADAEASAPSVQPEEAQDAAHGDVNKVDKEATAAESAADEPASAGAHDAGASASATKAPATAAATHEASSPASISTSTGAASAEGGRVTKDTGTTRRLHPVTQDNTDSTTRRTTATDGASTKGPQLQDSSKPSSEPSPADASPQPSSPTSSSPKHASTTSPRHAAPSDHTPKHAAA